MSFSIAANFNAAVPGPLTLANKTLVWADPAVKSILDLDKVGSRFSIEAGTGRYGGHAQKKLYPKGAVGETNADFYTLYFGPITGFALNIEYDMLVVQGFDLQHKGGKFGPWILWGDRSGITAGSSHGLWWDSQSGKPAVWEYIAQVNRGGYVPHELLVGAYGPPIMSNIWNHFKITVAGGPNGYARYYREGKLEAHCTMPTFSTPSDNVEVDFGAFAGGNDAGYAPANDGWTLHSGVSVYTTPA